MAAIRPNGARRAWRRGLPALTLVLALAGCRALPFDPPGADEAPAPPPEDRAAACAARGGDYRTAPAGVGSVCYVTPEDANAPCASAADCTGPCLARSRSCAPVVPLFGCHEVLNALGARETLCVN